MTRSELSEKNSLKSSETVKADFLVLGYNDNFTGTIVRELEGANNLTDMYLMAQNNGISVINH